MNFKYRNFTSIEGKLQLNNGEGLGNILISLNGRQHETRSRENGHFIFHGITSGIYLIDIQSIKYTFSQMKIKINTILK